MPIQHHQVSTILIIKYYQHYYGTEWIYWYNPTWNGSFTLKASAVKCWSIAMFDTLHWHLKEGSINTPPDQRPGIHSIDSRFRVSRELTYFWCVHMSWSTLGQIECRSIVEWASILMSRSVDRGFIKGIYWHLTSDTFSTDDPRK